MTWGNRISDGVTAHIREWFQSPEEWAAAQETRFRDGSFDGLQQQTRSLVIRFDGLVETLRREPLAQQAFVPYLRGELTYLEKHGRHVFFLIEGCRDVSSAKHGRGFFTETLRPELHEVRATLGAFIRDAVIAGAEEADACGLGFSAERQDWDLQLRVHTTHAVVTYHVDRWD